MLWISHFATYILPASPKAQPAHHAGQPVNDTVCWDTSGYAAGIRQKWQAPLPIGHLSRLQLHSELTVRQNSTNIHTLHFRLRHSNRHTDFNGTRISITVFTASSHSDIRHFIPNTNFNIISTSRHRYYKWSLFSRCFLPKFNKYFWYHSACRMHHIFQPLSIHHLSSVLYIKTMKHLITHFAPPFPAGPNTPHQPASKQSQSMATP
jgi:hypothetical protein